jgi:hypothetical protein
MGRAPKRKARRRKRAAPTELNRLLRTVTPEASAVTVKNLHTGEVVRVEDPKPQRIARHRQGR